MSENWKVLSEAENRRICKGDIISDHHQLRGADGYLISTCIHKKPKERLRQGCRFGPESSRQTLVSPIFRSAGTICGGSFRKMYRGQICNLVREPYLFRCGVWHLQTHPQQPFCRCNCHRNTWVLSTEASPWKSGEKSSRFYFTWKVWGKFRVGKRNYEANFRRFHRETK